MWCLLSRTPDSSPCDAGIFLPLHKSNKMMITKSTRVSNPQVIFSPPIDMLFLFAILLVRATLFRSFYVCFKVSVPPDSFTRSVGFHQSICFGLNIWKFHSRNIVEIAHARQRALAETPQCFSCDDVSSMCHAQKRTRGSASGLFWVNIFFMQQLCVGSRVWRWRILHFRTRFAKWSARQVFAPLPR